MDIEELDYVKIGQNIKRIRKQKGYTQEQLADMIGLSKVHVSNMENANTKVSLGALVKIAMVLDSSVDKIVGVFNHSADYQVEINEIMTGCDGDKARVLIETLRTMRREIDKI